MSQQKSAEKPLQWWQLSLMGVACTIGTGYFLGTGVGIRVGGNAILIAFILAAFSTFVVFDFLAKMTAADPMDGSFCAYSKKAFGRWAGFSSGWVYWSSELLIMGSQMAALSLFTRLWFPNVPLWIFASIYALLGIGIIAIGTKGFERMEHIFAVIKLAAIVIFVIIAVLALMGILGVGKHEPKWPLPLFPQGMKESWASMIYAFYSFGGIEVMGLLAIRLKDPKEAPKSGRVMIITLTALYILSLTLALSLAPWTSIEKKESPFVSSLKGYGIVFVPHLFNAAFIIAGFSTMIASLFAVTKILVTLAKDGNAPSLFCKVSKGKRSMPYFAFGITIIMLAGSILLALLMPDSVYEYITTAAALMLLYNWIFILLTSGRLLQLGQWGQAKRWIGVSFIIMAICGTLFHATSRPGFYISIGFLALIGCLTVFMSHKWKHAS